MGGSFAANTHRKHKDVLLKGDPNAYFQQESVTTSLTCLQSRPEVHWTLKNVQGYLSSIGAAVAVMDFDHDGYQDLFFTLPKEGEGCLYRNVNGQSFENVSDRLKTLPSETPRYPTMRGVFVDLDGDGWEDLIYMAYCPRVFKSIEGKSFVEQADTGLGCGYLGTAITVLDMNYDERPDLVIAAYLTKDIYQNPTDTIVMPDSFSASKMGSPVFVFENNGNFKFQTKDYGFDHKGWAHAIGTYRSVRTGEQLIWFSNDYGIDVAYIRKDKQPWKKVPFLTHSESYSRNGMNVEIVDLDEDGAPYIYVSQIFEGSHKLSGNMAWKWTGGNEFVDRALELGIDRCGWSWGAKFFDLENDGDLDLVVSNGFYTGSGERSYWYQLSVLDAGGGWLMSDAKNWPDLSKRSLAGSQRSCLFINQNGFYDIADKTHAYSNDFSDSRSAALLDYDNSGLQSVVVTAMDKTPRVLRSGVKQDNNWIGFEIVDSEKRFNWGSTVLLKLTNGKEKSRQAQPLNGYASQNDSRLHFGLGGLKVDDIKSVRMVWPDGTETHIDKEQISLRTYNKVVRP